MKKPMKYFARHLRRHREEVFDRADEAAEWALSILGKEEKGK